MLSTLSVVFPVFALILVGFISRKTKILGSTTCRELSRYVVYLALPAVLFDITANAHWIDVYHPGFIAAFGIGCFAVFAFNIFLDRKRHLADAAINGISAAYANTAFMGFPLCLAIFGTQSLAPVMIASIITVCILFGVAIVLIEISVQAEKRKTRILVNVLKALAVNPLVIAPVLGSLFALGGWGVPVSMEAFLKLLGASASPCALISIGLFLAEDQPVGERNTLTVSRLTFLKLILQPLLTWVLAVYVFQLEPVMTHMAVVIAALATGTGPFMLAERYHRDLVAPAKVIFLTTVLSLVTVTAYIYVAV